MRPFSRTQTLTVDQALYFLMYAYDATSTAVEEEPQRQLWQQTCQTVLETLYELNMKVQR